MGLIVNKTISIAKVNDDETMVYQDGSLKSIECDYNILSDVLNIINTFGEKDEVYNRYKDKFNKEEVDQFLDVLISENMIIVNEGKRIINKPYILLVSDEITENIVKEVFKDTIAVGYVANRVMDIEKIVNSHKFDCVFIANPDMKYEDAIWANKLLVKLQIPFIIVRYDGENIITGPFIFPMKGACLECSLEHHIDKLNENENVNINIKDLYGLSMTKPINPDIDSNLFCFCLEKIKKDIFRLNTAGSNGAEGNVIRTYLDTVFEMPFGVYSEDFNDIIRAKNILDEDHYGLEKVKDRILEYLSVRILNPTGNSPILCLVGPPGTGKTSIAKSVAKALGRKYVRISLGGVGDEAEIRGHRRTYVGAMPGRIVEAIKHAKVANPLLLLDEIDKSSKDYKGDVSAALLEVLDGEQNKTFRDRYLEIPLDLSKVLFIATANTLDTIPRPLLDRMDIIEISSYTENEKYHIAKNYLVPKEVEANGMKDKGIHFSDKAIKKIIHNYTREAGVRNLSRRIGDICRKCARESLEGKKSFKITEKNIGKYLGKEKVRHDEVEKEPQVGMVTGLAWTSVGGDTLSIEVNIMPGKGVLTLTGNMGDVMKESAGISKSLVRSMAKEYDIEEGFFEKNDIHLHIPEGAVPKDGPSAGVTMTTAIISAITGKPVRADVAMTGEITLRGKVLPIGGLKEKLLAAKLAGVKTVCVPKENEVDVSELSAEITGGLEIVYVKDIKEVLKVALTD